MPGYDDFTKFVLGGARVHIGGDYADYSEELGTVFGNVLFERPGPRALNRQLTPEQQFFRAIWNGYTEIQTACEALKDFEVFVTRFPFAKSRIKRTRYLRFIIESYLAEAYILKERMISYLTAIGRLFRGHARHGEVLRATRPMFDLVSDSLKPLTDLRSSHTHQLRYDDQELDRLGLLEILSQNDDDKEFLDAMREAYGEAWGRYRRLWKKRIRDNNKAIGTLLDLYFETIKDILYEADGHFKPHAIQQRVPADGRRAARSARR